MAKIILKMVDSNKSGKVTFSKDKIILSKKNPSEMFAVTVEQGWAIYDCLYLGKSYEIIDNGNGAYLARIKDVNKIIEDESWKINFSVDKD